MNIIVCLDDKGGMLFNKRRQSQDSVLRSRVEAVTRDSRLLMNEYSKKQFADIAREIIVDENFLNSAKEGDYCFVENLPIKNFEKKIEKIIVYRWNRVYPADFKFDFDLSGWNRVETCDFAGSSHEKITEEVYER